MNQLLKNIKKAYPDGVKLRGSSGQAINEEISDIICSNTNEATCSYLDIFEAEEWIRNNIIL